MPEATVCSVCERTILAGEVPRTYVTRDGAARVVCALCRPRAEVAGWIPEERFGEILPAENGRGARRGRGRMRRMIERARESAAIAASRPTPDERRREADAALAAEPHLPRHAAGELEPQPIAATRRHSVPQSPERRMRRAFESFNASEHRRMVAGLMRSLGTPWVSAVTEASTPGEVRITVAWELAWYQWEVDIAREGAQLRQIAKGDEISELPEADQAWNGRAGADGELRVGNESEGSDG
jgi:hypothetical protein